MKHSVANSILTLEFDQEIVTASDGNATLISEMLTTGEASRVKEVMLDLKGVANVDSAGLNFLVSIIKVAKGKGIKTKAVISHKSVSRIFKFTRMGELMDLEDLSE